MKSVAMPIRGGVYRYTLSSFVDPEKKLYQPVTATAISAEEVEVGLDVWQIEILLRQ